mmetsp:Transcript_14354/g.54138  ORF Transcript_14354/g.54138 Transcript_14354/m.54138 type:complete len:270 (-) Transcript_14354:137-946(-)
MASEEVRLDLRTAQRIGRELQTLARSPPEGIQLLQEESESITEIFAEISGPEETPYEGYSFRMKLVLSSDFPQSPPRGFFLTRIFHPNVSTNGDICVNTLKRDWQPTTTIGHVLQVIRCLLIVPFPESSLNDEAGKLFMDSYDEFKRRATIMAQVHAIPNGQESAERRREPIVTTARGEAGAALGDLGDLKSPTHRANKREEGSSAEGKENDDENANADQVNGRGKGPPPAVPSPAAAPPAKISAGKSAKPRSSRDRALAAKKKNLRRL